MRNRSLVHCIASLILCLTIVFTGGGARAQAGEIANCAELGAGFTLHPDFSFICCMPGAVPVRGEGRCEAQTSTPDPILQTTPTDGQTTPGQCIAKGQVCVLNATPCCSGTCSGTFPNTYCQ